MSALALMMAIKRVRTVIAICSNEIGSGKVAGKFVYLQVILTS